MPVSRVNTQMTYNQVQKLTLVIVWLVTSASGVVLFEPAPIDALMIGLVVLLPLVGLCRLTPSLVVLLVAFMVMCVAGLLTSSLSARLKMSIIHNAITIYLCFSAVVIAGFVYLNPSKHTRIILSAYTVAAVVAALAALVGYFHIVPGTYELFTEYGRASGTFKDPNVFGPFLIPVVLYCFHQWMERSFFKGLLPAAIILLLCFAILLCFSRGAWMHLALSMAMFIYFTYMFAQSNLQRLKLLSLFIAGVVLVTVGIGAALQSKKIRDLFEHRAAITQSYDVGPNGRFGGQRKAVDIILDNPLGIGVGVFGSVYHHEQPHNNYLTTFLRSGWIGGLVYLYLVLTTLVLGFRHLLRSTPYRPLFLIVFSSFVGLCLEGLLIDTDHWRHFYLLLGMVWGLMVAGKGESESTRARASIRNTYSPVSRRYAVLLPSGR